MQKIIKINMHSAHNRRANVRVMARGEQQQQQVDTEKWYVQNNHSVATVLADCYFLFAKNQQCLSIRWKPKYNYRYSQPQSSTDRKRALCVYCSLFRCFALGKWLRFLSQFTKHIYTCKHDVTVGHKWTFCKNSNRFDDFTRVQKAFVFRFNLNDRK